MRCLSIAPATLRRPRAGSSTRLVMPGEHYADLHRPGVAGRKWSISKLDGQPLTTFSALPAIVRYAKLAPGAVSDEAADILDQIAETRVA